MTLFSHAPAANTLAYVALISNPAFAAVETNLRARIVAESPQVGSPVVHFTNLVQLIWANRAALPPEALRFGAGCAFFCGWHGFIDQGEAFSMQAALQRDAGDDPPTGQSWPDTSTDLPAGEGWTVEPAA